METVQPSPLETASDSMQWNRPRLSSLTNSPPLTPNVPSCKKIRRKSSLIRRINSSEDIPSSHESIFHAERFSRTSSEDNDLGPWPKISLTPIITPAAFRNLVGNNENIRDQLLSPTTVTTPIFYGNGTALSTIAEQKSTTTVHTKASSVHPRSNSEASLARTSIQNFPSHRNSFDLPSSVTLRSPRRRKSFSADDLIIIKRSYHAACAMIEKRTDASSKIYDVYAEPRTPILPPIERLPTPPGMPSWTAAQNRPVKQPLQPQNGDLAGTRNKLQRFLGLRRHLIESSSHTPIPIALPHSDQSARVLGGGRSSSSPLPARVAPVFRPTRSGHGTGLLDSHPFHHAGTADEKSDAIVMIPGTQTSNRPPSSRPSGAQKIVKTASTGKRRRVKHPHIAGGIQISSRDLFASRFARGRYNEAFPQCPHHRNRQALLQSSNQPVEAVLPDLIPLSVLYHPLTPHEPQGDPAQPPLPSTSVIDEPPVVLEFQAPLSPFFEPVMTGAIALTTPTGDTPTKPTPQTHHRCWKCHASTLISALDGIWDTAMSWCCWVFCGVDLCDDEADSQGCVHGAGSQSGYAQRMLGPRRAVSDGNAC